MIKTIISIGIVLLTFSANAFLYGGTNLGMFGYPSHDCYKPIKPYKPISFDDQWSVDQYNMEVENYNSQLQIYISCIEDFVDNANNDIKRIREKAEEAINEANY